MKTSSCGTSVLTGNGIVAAVILMAIFTSINFLGIRKLAHTNSAATWWKVGIPLLTIFVLGIVNFHASNFTAADGFSPFGAKGVLSAISTSGIIFALLGFEQADQLAGRNRPDLYDVELAGLVRPEQERLLPDCVRGDRQARRAVGRAAHRVRRGLRLLPAVPELDVARRSDHGGERPHVRRRTA